MIVRSAPVARPTQGIKSLVRALCLLTLGISMIGRPVALRASDLHDAVRVQDLAVIEALMAAGAEIDQRDYRIGTALHLAISNGDLEIATILIDHGADLEAASELQGMRALHLAVQSGEVPVVVLLLDKGADVEAHDGLQRTSLLIAAIEGHVQVARLLLDRGAVVDGREGIRDRTPLMMASYFGRLETVELLIDRGADVNATDSFWDTSLSFAVGDASYRNARGPALIELLLAKGADPSIRRKDGLTPLGYAKVRGFKETPEILRSFGVTE